MNDWRHNTFDSLRKGNEKLCGGFFVVFCFNEQNMPNLYIGYKSKDVSPESCSVVKIGEKALTDKKQAEIHIQPAVQQ